jgi:hypothetical protein
LFALSFRHTDALVVGEGGDTMRFGPDHKFHVVVDPGTESELADILFEASLRDLDLQFKGGLTMAEHPTLFTDKGEAEVEAYGRLVAMRATLAIARSGVGEKLQEATRIEIIGPDGTVVFSADLPDRPR